MFQVRNLFTVPVLMLVVLATHATAASREDNTVRTSENVLKEFLELPTKRIPASLLAKAEGIAIIPKVVKVGFIAGGRRGKGVVLVKDKQGNWQPPTFVTLTGGSVGWQVGVQSTDVILIFTTAKSVDGLMKGKFTIGADAAAAAGPVGRQAQAATDLELKAEIYSYSRSRGLFAGVSLDGSMLQIDQGAGRSYYAVPAGITLQPGESAPIPESAAELIHLVQQQTVAGTVIESAEDVEMSAARSHTANENGQLEQIRGRLAQSALGLNSLIGREWQQFLALPADVYSANGKPSLARLQQTKKNFDQVSNDPRYRNLAQRAEFQATHQLLDSLIQVIQADEQVLSLPPPPSARSKTKLN